MMVLAVVAMVAGTVSAQTNSFSGTVDGPYAGNGAALYAPEINYLMTYDNSGETASLTAEFTFSEVLDEVEFNPQVRLGATSGFYPLTLVEGSTYSYTTTTDVAVGETMAVTVLFAWPGNASETTFEYVVGSDNQTVDEEAPEFVNVGYAAGAAGYDSVTLTVTVSDNSGKATVEVYKEEACETLLASQNITADGVTAQEVLVEGLEPETEYTLYVKAKDAAGNYSEVQTVNVTTTEAPDLEETVWYGVINNGTQWIEGADKYAPIINYTVTTTVENQLKFHITLSEVYEDGIGNAQLYWIVGGAESHVNMTKLADTEYETTILEPMEYERGESVIFRFRFEIPGAAPMTQNITDFTIGAANEAPEADVEKPVLTAVSVGEVGDKTAVLNVTVTDNSGVAVITVIGDNFEADEFTVTADGTAQTVELEGLTPETYYELTVGAKDIAGNVAEDVFPVDFTTTQEVIYEEVTVTGHVSGDKSEWDPGCQTAEYFPAFSYKVTTKGDNTLAFEVTMDDADYEGVVRAFVNGASNELAKGDGMAAYSGATTQTYERGSVVSVYFRFIPAGGTEVWTLPFNLEVGKEIGAGVAALEDGNVAIYAANGNLTVTGAEGETVRVYALSGALVYEATASGNESISLEKGIYIVVAGKTVKKIVL